MMLQIITVVLLTYLYSNIYFVGNYKLNYPHMLYSLSFQLPTYDSCPVLCLALYS